MRKFLSALERVIFQWEKLVNFKWEFLFSNKLAITWQLLGDSGDYLAIFRGFCGFGTFVGHIVHISNPEKGWW
ncbi:MAG: hypothetical protein C5S41_07475 [Candidatus Methanomarinus sp.]|nr:MAG: hypothetical protein C5S41_07475 [ANME-2 cluster archaeon]